MRNTPIGGREARDIDAQIHKILRGLGNPEPPLDLRLVRELKRLDLQFYSSTDAGILRTVVSRIKVGAQQLALRPMLLIDAIRKGNLRALYLPDKKRILIASETPPLKRRWAEAHEILHGITPWHEAFHFGDDDSTLRPECHAQLEREANYGAGRLLFLQERFCAEAADFKPTIDTVKALSNTYGNTHTSTLWRLVDEGHAGRAMFAMVSGNPNRAYLDGVEPRACRYLIESPLFRERFPDFTETEAMAILQSYCRPLRGGPLGAASVRLVDANGAEREFYVESWSNSYEVLTLGVDQGAVPAFIAR